MDHSLPGCLCPWDFPGKNTGVDSHSLLQGIFPTQGLNLGLLNCRQILYHLSQHGTIYNRDRVEKTEIDRLLSIVQSRVSIGAKESQSWLSDQCNVDCM